MFWLPTPARTSVAGVAARIVALLLVFGFAECAAGSCLSYGHSCWGAHGKRSGTVTAEGVPDDGPEAVAAIGVPEDTRWLLSKLVRQVEPGSRGKMWQRLAGASVPSVGDRRHREVQWKNSLGDEDAERAVENVALSRSRALRVEGSEESPAGIFVHSRGEYPVEENQDGDVLLMADDQAIRRVPQNLRVYKIMNQGRKLD